MKNVYLILLLFSPLLSNAQAEKGVLSAGTQLYQNIMLPDNYQGFGVGVDLQLDIYRGVGAVANVFYELNDLANAGRISRVQRGLAVNYVPFYKKKLSPWLQVGAVYNTIEVVPVSYLFADNSASEIAQNYFSLNIGIGGRYYVNDNFMVNTGVYFQPQNYIPNYFLESSELGNVLQTNTVNVNPEIDPLVYFNIGFTYKITKLW